MVSSRTSCSWDKVPIKTVSAQVYQSFGINNTCPTCACCCFSLTIHSGLLEVEWLCRNVIRFENKICLNLQT